MIKVEEQTDKEKLEMYMKCTKEELAKMLISANNHIDNLSKIYVKPFSAEGKQWAKKKIEEKYLDAR